MSRIKTYPMKSLRELYRVDNKYWKTGDTDILPKRSNLGREIDDKFGEQIADMVSIATRDHLSVQSVVEALAALGYVAMDDEDEEE